MKVCFFVARDWNIVRSGFYYNDYRILKELGHDVVSANSFRSIPTNVDLIFAWWASSGFPAILKAKLHNIPSVLVAAGFDVCSVPEIRDGFAYHPFHHRLAIRWALRNASKVLAVSKRVQKDVRSIAGVKSELVYNCVDTTQFRPLHVEKENIIITMGSHRNEKNNQLILNALRVVRKSFPDVKFVFGGNYRDKRIFAPFKDQVVLPGFLNERKKVQWFNKSKVYIQPSFFESFGVGIAEAMACGLPVIVSKKGAITEIAGPKGIYVSTDDANQLADRIILLLKNRSIRETLGRYARKRIVDNFSFEARKQKIQEVISQLVDWPAEYRKAILGPWIDLK